MVTSDPASISTTVCNVRCGYPSGHVPRLQVLRVARLRVLLWVLRVAAVRVPPARLRARSAAGLVRGACPGGPAQRREAVPQRPRLVVGPAAGFPPDPPAPRVPLPGGAPPP